MRHALHRGAVDGAAATAGDVVVRNHDLMTGHSIALRVYGPTGDVRFESRFELTPGAAATRAADLDSGSYTVEVGCDGEDYLVETRRLDDGEGVLVAAGNGVVDVAARPAR